MMLLIGPVSAFADMNEGSILFASQFNLSNIVIQHHLEIEL